MKQTDNPAKRLHAILSQALNKKPNEQTIKVWASVFGVPEKDAAGRVFYYLGLLHQLTYAVEERINRIPDINAELYLRALPDIRLALSPVNTQQSFTDTAGRHLGAGTMTVLEFAANELGKHHHEDTIPQEELDSIKKDFSDLFKNIREAEIDEDLRTLLLDLCVMALRAIDEYQIRGAAGLRDVVAFSVGQIILNHDLCDDAKGEPVMKRFTELLGKITTVVTSAIKVYQLYGKVAPVLGLPPASGDAD
jgi:hypothetical protein